MVLRGEIQGDTAAALSRLTARAEAGNAYAEEWLGWLYAWGNAAMRDYTKAEQWLRRAADDGSASSARLLSMLYEERKRAPTNTAQARSQYESARKPASPPSENREDVAQPKETPTQATTDVTAPVRSAAEVAEDQSPANSMVPTLLPQRAASIAAPKAIDSIGQSNLRLPRYHALLIAVQHYKKLPHLKTPFSDVKAIGSLLQTRYGFEGRVKMLFDPTREDITKDLVRLRSTLNANDSLLIYFAGHGRIDSDTERGYWLPVDAGTDEAYWLANDDIINYLKAMRARHVLLIADSCFSGSLTRDASLNGRPEGNDDEWIARMLERRARTVVTSGGLEPVLDGGAGANSVFARALLGVLQDNRRTAEMQFLFQDLKRRVVLAARQTPEYGDVRFAGHELGDFVFSPTR